MRLVFAIAVLVLLAACVYGLAMLYFENKKAEARRRHPSHDAPDVLVIAGDEREFRDWCEEQAAFAAPGKKIGYASEARDVYRLPEGSRIVLTGSWWDSPVLTSPSRHEVFNIIRERNLL